MATLNFNFVVVVVDKKIRIFTPFGRDLRVKIELDIVYSITYRHKILKNVIVWKFSKNQNFESS